jgi:hypothetical protein
LKRFTEVFDDKDMFVGASSGPLPAVEKLPPQPPAPDRGARLEFRGR